MPYDEQKLHHFETSILSEANQKVEEIEKEISNFSSSEIEKTRQEEYDKMFGYMQARVKEIKQKYDQMVTKEKLNSNRELCEFRNSLLEDILLGTRQKIEEFTQSDSYPDYLTNKIQASASKFPCDNSTIYLSEKDMKYADKIKSVLHVEVEQDKNNTLGGFKIVNLEKGLLLDETFDSSLEEQRRKFYKQCKLTV